MSIVTLSVGGTKYETTIDTLCRDPDSMLAAMFSGRHAAARNSKGHYFIDRDGKLFSYILNYLRNQQINIPAKKLKIIPDLILEAEYFQINSLINDLKEIQSKLHTPTISYSKLLTLLNSIKPIQLPFLNMSFLTLKYLDCTGANLQACDFSCTSILEVNFSQANLSFCIFDKSVVQNSIFVDSIMKKVSCVSANFSGNDMKRAVCVEANFARAKLGGADMRLCDLQSANLQECNLLVANMEGSNLLLANVKGANFEGANIKGVKGANF